MIAEVIGGILLGPSVMGRIPGFTDAIFPQESIPNLNLVANLGLVLFLFLVGLEVDMRWLISNWRPAVSVGLAGMALPFGLGCALAWGLYHEFQDEPNIVPIEFGTFMLFVGVAMAITVSLAGIVILWVLLTCTRPFPCSAVFLLNSSYSQPQLVSLSYQPVLETTSSAGFFSPSALPSSTPVVVSQHSGSS